MPQERGLYKSMFSTDTREDRDEEFIHLPFLGGQILRVTIIVWPHGIIELVCPAVKLLSYICFMHSHRQGSNSFQPKAK